MVNLSRSAWWGALAAACALAAGCVHAQAVDGEQVQGESQHPAVDE